MTGCVVTVVIALVVAAVSAVVAVTTAPRPDDTQRDDIRRVASSALTALMTVTDGEASDVPAVRRQLADPLLGRYDAVGVDVVLPGALAASVTMTVTVVGVAVSSYERDRARVLAFVDQVVTVPDASSATPAPGSTAPDGGHTPSERWVVLSKVDGTWRMADLQTVGDITR